MHGLRFVDVLCACLRVSLSPNRPDPCEPQPTTAFEPSPNSPRTSCFRVFPYFFRSLHHVAMLSRDARRASRVPIDSNRDGVLSDIASLATDSLSKSTRPIAPLAFSGFVPVSVVGTYSFYTTLYTASCIHVVHVIILL